MTRTVQACRMTTGGCSRQKPQQTPPPAPAPTPKPRPASKIPRGFEDPNRRQKVINIDSPIVID